MRPRDLLDLLLLAALWGASFLFLRLAAPAFGPVALIEVRVAIAAIVLLPLLVQRGGLPALRTHGARIATVGVLNSALPFVLLAYATLTLTAGFTSIVNATVPLWTALIGWLWLRDRFRAAQWLGLAIGAAGIVVLVWDKVGFQSPDASAATLAVAAALGATLSYGVAANLAKKWLAGVPPLATATGSQIGAALALAPLASAAWPAQSPSASLWLVAAALGIACTGIAYVLYFRLLAHVGPMRAASVTLLIPLFATAWSAVFLGEAITASAAAGGAVVLMGTALALGLIGAPRLSAARR